MHAKDTATLIHCDQGLSRAPTLAYAYLAKRGYLHSEEEFRAVYPDWAPGGIWEWLTQNWDSL